MPDDRSIYDHLMSSLPFVLTVLLIGAAVWIALKALRLR